MMTRYVALLRGINLGRRMRIEMRVLGAARRLPPGRTRR